MVSSHEIRSAFLDYFGRNDHSIVASSSLVPINDPTLLFTNSGMVQFKNLFLGSEKGSYKRAVTTQKCLRAGGKHNDLENVGYTVRHHTFFEMLGNFSFGDYFKETAIELAWKFLTKELELNSERLLVTVYNEDEESYKLWRKIGNLNDSRIIRISTSDNFWSMGALGPCGPCSEIFYDHGPEVLGGPPGSLDEDGDRFVEIWNLVFMQYEQISPNERIELPKPSIDTGMGLERISAVLQGKYDNYETDLLRGLVLASAEVSGTDADGPSAISHRVIADHIRACSFLIADGITPSNDGRGYVLRRIMRRAMRHAHLLGCDEPMVFRLVSVLVQNMGQIFPELKQRESLITETLKLEETRFKKTLGRGLRMLDEAIQDLKPEAEFNGVEAFRLYDTFGFPLDLTQDILRGRGLRLDVESFEQEMQRQRSEARKAWSGSGDAMTDKLWFKIKDEVGLTEFLGYDNEVMEGVVLALVVDGKAVNEVEAEGPIEIVTNQTPFYAEAGGQVGDTGFLSKTDGTWIQVINTKLQLDNLIVHEGILTKGTLRIGDTLEMCIDESRRACLSANHSVTHILHEVLRCHLGSHVEQKGSLVAPEYLRFDFSHPDAMTSSELVGVENEVNLRIRENLPVVTRSMTLDSALELGARALFGESYGEEVRVVSLGRGKDKPFSIELCGGTHVTRTGDIGFFKIDQETGVAAGVRRIEALTGQAASSHVDSYQKLLAASASAVKAPIASLPERISLLVKERRSLEREVGELRRKLATEGNEGFPSKGRKIGGAEFVTRKLDNMPPKELKPLVDSIKSRISSGVVVAIANNDGKASIVVGVTEDLVARISAIDLVSVGSRALGGKGGGGRPDMAQAGGPDAKEIDAAIAAVESLISTCLT